MILIKKGTPPSELEELKQKAEFWGLSDKEGYDLLRNPLKKEVRNSLVQEHRTLRRRAEDGSVAEVRFASAGIRSCTTLSFTHFL